MPESSLMQGTACPLPDHLQYALTEGSLYAQRHEFYLRSTPDSLQLPLTKWPAMAVLHYTLNSRPWAIIFPNWPPSGGGFRKGRIQKHDLEGKAFYAIQLHSSKLTFFFFIKLGFHLRPATSNNSSLKM